MSDTTSRGRSRRDLLAGAAAAAATLAASKLALPDAASAADGDQLVLGTENTAATRTTLTGPDVALRTNGSIAGVVGTGALDVVPPNVGVAGVGQSAGSIGVHGRGLAAGVYGESQDEYGGWFRTLAGEAGVVGVIADWAATVTLPNQIHAGVYGHAIDSFSAGAWGDNVADGIGVVGTGAWGVYGTGAVGVVGDVGASGVGLYGFAGSASAPAPPAGRAVYARAGSTSQFALETNGKLRFTNRAARTTIAAGASSKKVTLAGVTSSSYVVATLNSRRTGVYVASVVCASGYFTIYLNKAATSSTYVAYLVIN